MELRSVLIICLVSLATVSGRKFKCHHNSSAGPVRHVHLEPVANGLPKNRAVTFDQRLRIFVHYDSSVSQTLTPSIQTRLKSVVSKLVAFFESIIHVRQTRAPIILDRDCQGGTFYIFNQPPTRRCKFSCITTMCGEVQVPDQHLKACSQCFGSSSNCQTSGSDGPGVSNADFVLYVSAKSTSDCSGSTIAYASHCHLEDNFDRPVVGHSNFCPSKISKPEATDDFILAVAKHEVLHALAFSNGLYAFWRDENGNPRTPRNANGLPPSGPSGYIASTSTLKRVTYNNWKTRSGLVSHTVTQLVTPKIVAAGIRHFNCPTLEGVEVENQGGPGTSLSHWEKRLLENEGMTGVISPSPVFSILTFALLEDSGWYKVDYSKAEQLVWGKNTGCDLPTGSCGGYIQNRQNRGSSIDPFCNRLKGVSQQLRGCTMDRTTVSECSLASHSSPLPVEYQYFNSGENFGGSTGVNVDLSSVGGNEIPDYCPYQNGFSNGYCADSSNTRTGISNHFAETYTVGSRCVEHGGPWMAGNTASTSYGAGCYQYSCSNGQVTLFVLGKAYTCSSEGKTISVDVTVGGVRYQGSLICPSCIEICYDDFDNCPAAARTFAGFNSPVGVPGPSYGPAPTGGGNGTNGNAVTPLLTPLLLLVVALLVLLIK